MSSSESSMNISFTESDCIIASIPDTPAMSKSFAADFAVLTIEVLSPSSNAILEPI